MSESTALSLFVPTETVDAVATSTTVINNSTVKKTKSGSFAYFSSSVGSAASIISSGISYSVTAVGGTMINSVDSALDFVGPTDPFLRLRPSWNVVFSTAIKTLRVAAHTVSHDTRSIRLLTDHGIPSVLLPSGVSHLKSLNPPGEWTFLKSTNFNENKDLQKSAIILYFHGGAFCCCGSKTHRGLLYRLVKASEAIVFAVDYRRPPEFPFPCPVDDCIDAYKFLLTQVDSTRIIFAGDSAGGSLVASVAIEARKRGLPAPAGGLMLSPWVDLSDVGITDSWYRNEAYDYLPQGLARFFAKQYMGTLVDDGIVSPIYSKRLEDLPPLHIELGECEVLHDQIIAFAEKAKAHGVQVDVNVRQDMVHVFCLFAVSGLLQCQSAFESMAMFVRARTRESLLATFPTIDIDLISFSPHTEAEDVTEDEDGTDEELRNEESAL
jgi:monoterpene epsilon-lactone hydrolase